ncbi:MAG TPA: Rieske 2Fe-2S domain-containing protein [Thermomicrobiales bacterium]|nr:Rieske 2Fe-2S domain-containing protein [Thermomicrobiales bacterium]
MTPLARTLTGLAGGWLVGRALGLVARLQSSHGSAGAKKLTSRRSFTRNAALGSALIVTAEIAAGTIYLLWPNKTGAFGGEINVGVDSVPPVDGRPFRHSEGKFYLVHTADGLQALWWKCVHLGCTVPWVAGQQHFICPCHGSVYAYNGDRISGPAPRAMDAFPMTVNSDGGVTIDTNPSTVIVRNSVEPDQITPYA